MATTAQLIFVLSGLISITGSSDVFGLVGSSVPLNIQDPVPEFSDFFWVFNRTDNVLKYNKKHNDIESHSSYKDRVEFSNKTYTLTLKNLQKADIGLYEAKAFGDKIKDVATYKLTVFDPLEAPLLSYNLGSDPSNITFTCRVHDLSISSSCYKETCEEKTVTSQAFNLSLFINGCSIICNHSNPVSWRESVVEMNELEQHCADEGKSKVDTTPSKWLLLVLVPVGFIGVAICWYLKKRISKGLEQREYCGETVYAKVEKPKKQQNNGAEMMILETPPFTVYSTVGRVSSPTTSDLETQKTHEMPETIFSKVSKPVTEAK